MPCFRTAWTNIPASLSISIRGRSGSTFLLGTLFLADLVDTAIKGLDHFASFGTGYPVQQGVLFALSIAALFIADRRFHGAFASLAIAAEIYWIASRFEVLA